MSSLPPSHLELPAVDAALRSRMERLLLALERLAGGDLEERVPISPQHDALDAIAHAANVLAGELQYASRSLREDMNTAEAASRSKTAVLRSAARAVRSPALAILDDLRALASPGLDDARRTEALARTLGGAQALLALSDDLLDVANVESGTFEYDMQCVPLRETVIDVVRALELDAERKGLALLLEVVPPLPATIVVDGRRLRQILGTLVGNAIRFTERGHVVVRLQAAGPSAVALEVIDTGVGIAASEAEALFTPFRAMEGTKLGAGGFGLALAKRLAEGMGGDVRLLESMPGRGAAFCALLSVGTPDAPDGAAKDDLRDR